MGKHPKKMATKQPAVSILTGQFLGKDGDFYTWEWELVFFRLRAIRYAFTIETVIRYATNNKNESPKYIMTLIAKRLWETTFFGVEVDDFAKASDFSGASMDHIQDVCVDLTKDHHDKSTSLIEDIERNNKYPRIDEGESVELYCYTAPGYKVVEAES